jgi:DNA topoisomerase VI subunit A
MGSGAWSIPSRVEHLRFETKAKLVLVVETASLFQRLVHHRYYEKANCVLISMSGVPTRACRRFIRRLADDRGCRCWRSPTAIRTGTATSTGR